MPTALGLLAKVKAAYRDATVFRDKEGEKVFFYHNGCKFILHPMPRGVRVTVKRGERQLFSGVVSSGKFDIGKFVSTLNALVAKAPTLGRAE